MKKRNVRIIALMLAAVIAAGSPMPVRAADFEIEEEIVLGGTGENQRRCMKKSRRRLFFRGQWKFQKMKLQTKICKQVLTKQQII